MQYLNDLANSFYKYGSYYTLNNDTKFKWFSKFNINIWILDAFNYDTIFK